MDLAILPRLLQSDTTYVLIYQRKQASLKACTMMLFNTKRWGSSNHVLPYVEQIRIERAASL